MTPRRHRRDAGYALVAAVASILVFAALALAQVTAMRAAVISGEAEVDAARAAAAADAGIAIAIGHLITPDDRSRWVMDGRLRQVGFETARLSIRIDDERGKVPINLIEEDQVTRMLEAVGLQSPALQVARDSLLDWIDDDDEPRTDGAEADFYRPRGYEPRNSYLFSIGELARIRGFTPQLVARLAPFVTVHFSGGAFEPRYAQPQALGVMLGTGGQGPDAIARTRELAGQTTALGFISAGRLVGRPLSVHVIAELPSGARAERTLIVELTGAASRPYVIRSYE